MKDKDKENKELNRQIIDTIMERPYGFTIDELRYYLYPVTLGKSFLLSELISQLEIDSKLLSLNPAMEALRIVSKKKDIICKMIAYMVIKSKKDLFNADFVNGYVKTFSTKLTNEEIAQLLLIILRQDHTEQFIKYLKLDKEQEEQRRISRLKNDKGNTITFGGRSLWGQLISAACEKYGWTLDYVVWGISQTNLRMMLADAVNSVYLSDDEKKKVRITSKENRVNMDDPKNWEMIKSMKWD